MTLGPDTPPPEPDPPAIEPGSRLGQVRRLLREGEKPGAAGWPALLLVVTFALFMMGQWGNALDTLAMIVVVLLVHEGGHFLAMRAFGYRDVRMFFIPFFGAAVSGKKETAPDWQEAVVLLLGPLPGILVGLALYAAAYPPAGSWWFGLMQTFVYLNAFNLLPFAPLDGGRLFEVLLTRRRPLLGAALRVVAVAGLGYLAFLLGSWVLGLLAVLMLGSVPVGFKASDAAASFRVGYPDPPADPGDLTDDQLRELVKAADGLVTTPLTPEQAATWVRVMHGEAVAPRAGVRAGLGFLAAYLLGWAAAVGYVYLVDTDPSYQPQPPPMVDLPPQDDDAPPTPAKPAP